MSRFLYNLQASPQDHWECRALSQQWSRAFVQVGQHILGYFGLTQWKVLTQFSPSSGSEAASKQPNELKILFLNWIEL